MVYAALEKDYPTTIVDEDGEELNTLNRTQIRELAVLQEDWKVNKTGSPMELSWTSTTRTPMLEESQRDAKPTYPRCSSKC
jgi:hypothetical protein